jgi:choline-sulfatase
MAFLKERGLLATHVDDMKKRGSNRFVTFPTPLPEDAYGDNWIAAGGLKLLSRAPAGRPWFIQVNFAGPHDPMDITERMDRECRSLKRFPPPAGEATLSPEHLAARQNYSAMVENIDRWLGTYLECLRERGDLDNTVVVWSSDHGEMLGDRGAWGKSKPWQPSIGVPMVFAGTALRGGIVHAGPATTADLAATFLELAGAARPAEMDSRSLVPLLSGKTDRHRDCVLSGLGPWRVAFDGRHKLITGWSAGAGKKAGKDADAAAAEPLLFDLSADPQEQTNLAARAPQEVARLTEALRKG